MRYFLNCSCNYAFNFRSIFLPLDDSMLNLEHHKILWMNITQLYTKTNGCRIDNKENNNFCSINISIGWNNG
ncbi:Lysine-specific demethylase 6B [Formica fusca]